MGSGADLQGTTGRRPPLLTVPGLGLLTGPKQIGGFFASGLSTFGTAPPLFQAVVETQGGCQSNDNVDRHCELHARSVDDMEALTGGLSQWGINRAGNGGQQGGTGSHRSPPKPPKPKSHNEAVSASARFGSSGFRWHS